jgi:hypothetical protein
MTGGGDMPPGVQLAIAVARSKVRHDNRHKVITTILSPGRTDRLQNT